MLSRKQSRTRLKYQVAINNRIKVTVLVFIWVANLSRYVLADILAVVCSDLKSIIFIIDTRSRTLSKDWKPDKC